MNPQKTQTSTTNISFLQDSIRSQENDSRSSLFQEIADYIYEKLEQKKTDLVLEYISNEALKLGVSDMHIDPSEHDSVIRFRLDGKLVDIVTLIPLHRKALIERLKYRSDLKLNIIDVPQDGKFRFNMNDTKVDVRVSTLPTRYGESIVCRILDTSGIVGDFSDLGISWMNKRKLENIIGKKQGMILVTGPTGSGKTTTLYTLLDKMNESSTKIITLEDPIEYEISGIVQSEIDEKKGYTFASGMRAILRQDPDIVMVGEIRDLTTAQTAVQASMTGHLVLSTLHTKSAIETLERLINIGIETYDIASSCDLIIAQRLIRRLCPDCKKRVARLSIADEETIQTALKNLHIENPTSKHDDVYTASGCDTCNGSGYKGRMGVFEVLSLDDDLREMIRDGSSSQDLLSKALEGNFYTLADDAILKVLKGETDFAEIRGLSL